MTQTAVRTNEGHAARVKVLEITSLVKYFGGVKAVDGVDLEIREGEVFSVIGPNGAGKTTLFNIVTGFYEPDRGDILFGGQHIERLKPNQITQAGISRTFQAVRLFGNMTVLENVMVGQHCRTKSGFVGPILGFKKTRQEENEIRERSREILSFFGDRFPPRVLDELASGLSYADRRRLEIARAMATDPRLLLLDEPTAGMNPAETEGLTRLIRRLCDERGLTVVVIEHDMRLVKGVSDRVAALDYGKKIAEGTYDEVSSNEQVIEAYLGKRHEEERKRAGAPRSDTTTEGPTA